MVNFVFIIASIVVITDRITKYIFFENSSLNKGAAFGILQGYNWLFISIAIVVIIAVIMHRNNKDYILGMGLILGGTLGNLIDRIFYSGVIDFISLSIVPSFNIADLANTIGAVLIIYEMHKD